MLWKITELAYGRHERGPGPNRRQWKSAWVLLVFSHMRRRPQSHPHYPSVILIEMTSQLICRYIGFDHSQPQVRCLLACILYKDENWAFLDKLQKLFGAILFIYFRSEEFTAKLLYGFSHAFQRTKFLRLNCHFKVKWERTLLATIRIAIGAPGYRM